MRHYEGLYTVMVVPTTPAQVPNEKTRGHPSAMMWRRGLFLALKCALAKEARHECCLQPGVHSHLLRMRTRA